MPVKRASMWDYIVHVQKADAGDVSELTGTMEGYSQNEVYGRLSDRALKMGGWMVSCHINEQEDDLPFVPDVTPHHIGVQPRREVQVVPATPSIFDDDEIFGVYYGEYKGASLCTYKETGK